LIFSEDTDPKLEECKILCFDERVVVFKIDGHLCTFESLPRDVKFKPLPKHTEQELLAYEAFKVLNPNHDTSISQFLRDKLNYTYKQAFSLVESGRFK